MEDDSETSGSKTLRLIEQTPTAAARLAIRVTIWREIDDIRVPSGLQKYTSNQKRKSVHASSIEDYSRLAAIEEDYLLAVLEDV